MLTRYVTGEAGKGVMRDESLGREELGRGVDRSHRGNRKRGK